MIISRNSLNELREIQEDIAEYFCDKNFPISGETYWTCILSLAEAKIMEIKGGLN